ncbi:MAG: hypothetical protein BGO31_09350 [Bacteroidetes bacterium 43-16]|nr:MAG: hypothetical protein BGO31_09350 [Bacteroidetes bacterium 43-16]
MQKHLLSFGLSAILLSGAVFGMTSCVRSYRCECKIAYEGKPGLPTSPPREYEIKDTNKNAKSLCQGASKTYTDMGIVTIETCDLK